LIGGLQYCLINEETTKLEHLRANVACGAQSASRKYSAA
jgi:hypothetical protein